MPAIACGDGRQEFMDLTICNTGCEEKNPTWTAGKPIFHKILDEIFAGDTPFQEVV